MTEYKFQNATVRIHGSVNLEVLRTATERFMKKAFEQKKHRAKEKNSKG